MGLAKNIVRGLIEAHKMHNPLTISDICADSKVACYTDTPLHDAIFEYVTLRALRIDFVCNLYEETDLKDTPAGNVMPRAAPFKMH